MDHLTHSNGKGQIYDQAFVCPNSYLAREAVALNRSMTFDSFIGGVSQICDDAVVVRSEVFTSLVMGHARVYGGSYLDGVVVRDNASISNARVRTPAQSVRGVTIGARMTIDRGEWTRAPRYVEIDGDGLQVGLTECVEGRFHVGCWCRTLHEWESRQVRSLALCRAGWQRWHVELALDSFRYWHARPLSSCVAQPT